MNTKTLFGLISVGIIVIGAGGYSYYSIKESPSVESSARSSNNPILNVNKSQSLKTHQSNSFDSSFTPPVTDHESDKNTFSTREGTSLTALERETFTGSQANGLDRQESNVWPDTAESSLSLYGNVGALTWEPSTVSDYESIQIRVSGPNNVAITEDFYSGEVAIITEPLPDGYYHWQSVTTPKIDPFIKKQLTAVRESGDSVKERELLQRFRDEGRLLTHEQAKNNVRSGGFRVVNGQILDGDIRE